MSDTERQSFLASGQLISITDAAKQTPYSAEYLSLRARTGHLKALKIARNWLTTREAVLSYMTEQDAKHWRTADDRAAKVSTPNRSNQKEGVRV